MLRIGNLPDLSIANVTSIYIINQFVCILSLLQVDESIAASSANSKRK